MKKLELFVDYVLVDGKVVFTREYLLRRGWCCNKACVNCPYVQLDKGQ
jgi:hypothetical protein